MADYSVGDQDIESGEELKKIPQSVWIRIQNLITAPKFKKYLILIIVALFLLILSIILYKAWPRSITPGVLQGPPLVYELPEIRINLDELLIDNSNKVFSARTTIGLVYEKEETFATEEIESKLIEIENSIRLIIQNAALNEQTFRMKLQNPQWIYGTIETETGIEGLGIEIKNEVNTLMAHYGIIKDVYIQKFSVDETR